MHGSHGEGHCGMWKLGCRTGHFCHLPVAVSRLGLHCVVFCEQRWVLQLIIFLESLGQHECGLLGPS